MLTLQVLPLAALLVHLHLLAPLVALGAQFLAVLGRAIDAIRNRRAIRALRAIRTRVCLRRPLIATGLLLALSLITAHAGLPDIAYEMRACRRRLALHDDLSIHDRGGRRAHVIRGSTPTPNRLCRPG